MARTKQTARPTTRGKPPRAQQSNKSSSHQHIISKDDLTKKRKEFQEEREENKKIKSSHQQQQQELINLSSSFADLLIKCSEPNNGINDLFQSLKNKMSEHVCSRRCSMLTPVINYKVLERDTFFECNGYSNVLVNVGDCEQIYDEECPSFNLDFALDVFSEFIREWKEFEAKVIQNDSAALILEYSTCGKLCFYKRVGRDFEIMILLINKYEYFYFGQSSRFAFYGMPGLIYTSSSARSPNISKLQLKKVDESFVPIPFNDLLDNANDYIDKLLTGRYH